jgi:hypothetical protein
MLETVDGGGSSSHSIRRPTENSGGSSSRSSRTTGYSGGTTVSLSNPVPLFDVNANPMDVHDGTIHQWVEGGPFYYYGMSYDRCRFRACGDPTCGHLTDHKVLVWKSATLANRSWTLVGDALPVDSRPNGTCVGQP